MSQSTPIASRPEIYATAPAHHGAFDYAELERLKLDPGAILDFSVNSNPYGPSPKVVEALAAVPLDRYPDREALGLRRALAEHLGIDPAHILVGNGSAELLWLAAFVYLQLCDWVLVVGPTFGEYSRTASLMGARIQTWQARVDENFAISSEAIHRQLHHLKPQIVFLCNPNNPTGYCLSLEMIGSWAEACPGTLFVVDEAYLAFSAQTRSALSLRLDNILVLRSMTKDYALAGLRLGYAVSHNLDLISTLTQVRPAWNVNGLAQTAGLAALEDQAYLHRCLDGLSQAKARLVTDLTTLGLPPVPSTTHFFLVHVNNGPAFRLALLKKKILVRDCTSFGLPAYVRIATRRSEENGRLVAEIESLIRAGRLTVDGNKIVFAEIE